ncbi:outer membrane protein [Methylobacterium radiodurans]|uniref:Porin n=1 Tax=Methylobacterium radiodurans TaxID=2202828 RepID=A0A2U8VPL8_9HYPH|nr:outer membrane beta-barrel protein [Methylobacterium radiodurans]AWN35564.1 porin [Methylobacterium radiodurans]
MARSKLTALARRLTLAASVGAPCLAQAADLLPPPPPPPPPPPVVDVGGGWYLRGEVGVSALRLGKFEGHDKPGFPQPDGGYHPEYREIGDQAFAGGGFGYEFGNGLRVEAVAQYRTSTTLRFGESYAGCFNANFDKDGNCKSPGKGIDLYTGQISSIVAMARGSYDLFTWNGVSFFGGGSVGAAFHHVGTFVDVGAGTAVGGAGYIGPRDTTTFAWGLHAGLGYAITPNLRLELAYEYLNLGSVKTAGLNCFGADGCPGTVYKFKNIEAHDVRLGFRYLIGGLVAAPLPPLMADYAPPPPGPLVRKY